MASLHLPHMHIPAYGVDVSNHNGMFNWLAWKGHIQFAEIKCTEGLDFPDMLYPQNMRESEGLGEFYRFPYHFAHPEESPAEQAKFFVDTAKPFMKATDHFVLDLETSGELDPVYVSFWAWTFCTEVNRLEPHHRILVQTFPDFADAGYCARLGQWHLWVMDWGVPEPRMPIGPWKEWAFWQSATGAVDRDVAHGNLDWLRWFTGHTGPSLDP